MSDEEQTTAENPEHGDQQEEPSKMDQLYGLARGVISRAADAYDLADGGQGLTYDITQALENPQELDAVASATLEKAYANFAQDFLNDPAYRALIYGVEQADGTISGGDPDLWHSSYLIDGKVNDFYLEADGNFYQEVMDTNQDGMAVNAALTREANRPGQNPTRNLMHMNDLSIAFWDNVLAKLSEEYNMDSRLTNTEEISNVLQTGNDKLLKTLQTISSRDDIDEEFRDDLLANDYTTDELREMLDPRAEQKNAIEGLDNMILRLRALQDIRKIAATRDLADYIVNGALPAGVNMNKPFLSQVWNVNWNDSTYTDDNDNFRWEAANEMRVWDPQIYMSLNKGNLNTAQFEGHAYAEKFIAQQGWEGEMNTAQFSALTRHIMVMEVADRHGIERPYSGDALTDEMKQAFAEDFEAAKFHLHDLDFAFNAGDYTRHNQMAAAIAEQRQALGLSPGYSEDNIEFDAPRIDVNADEWQSFFGRDTQIMQANGEPIDVQNATISIDQAVDYFFRVPHYRENFGYNFDDQFDGYDMSYEELLEAHGDTPGKDGMTAAQSIAEIMETVSSRQYIDVYAYDGGPGDFAGDYERKYKAGYQDQLQERLLLENNVKPSPEATSHPDGAIAPHVEVETQVTEKAEAKAGSTMTAGLEAEGTSVTPEELRANCDDCTTPSPEMIAAMGGGPEYQKPIPAANPGLNG